MRKRTIIHFGVILLTVVLFLLFRKTSVKLAAISKPLPPEQTPLTNLITFQTNLSLPAISGVPSGASRADKISWEREMQKKDPYYDYKLPISFYGRVVDDQGQPVATADVQFVWTDLSDAGTSKKTNQSDSNGLFSLTDATGKNLMVYVSKDGYKRYLSKSKNQTSFEYSVLAGGNYYVSDPMNPVVFVLRKDHPAKFLIKLAKDFPISTNRPTIFKLNGDSSTEIRIDLLANQRNRNGAWAMRISVSGGGVQISTNEFPFEAPEEGYEPSLVLDKGTAKPETWPGVYQGGEFFIKTTTGYGRVHLQMLASATHLSVDAFYNPDGSPDLEP